MIPVKKNFDEIPESLQISKTNPLKPALDKTLSVKCRNTQKARLEIIQNFKRFPEEKKFSDLYKREDIKESLEKTYHNKCAYCEQYDENLHVEHFRPKAHYYWFAYSWDNLLLACATCNSHKLNQFPLDKEENQINNFDVKDISEIHSFAGNYNETEKPLLLNPENPEDWKEIDEFYFDEDGNILSKSKRGEKTIEVLKLNRKKLFVKRYKIIEKLERKINSVFKENKDKTSQTILLNDAINEFVKEAYSPDNDFVAFRQYIMKHFLNKIAKQ